MTTTDFITELIEKINSYDNGEGAFRAVFSHSERVSPLPVDKVYIAFSPYATDVSFFENDNLECCKKTKITVKISFYCSPKMPLSELSELCDRITDRLQVDYEGRFSGCKIGFLQVDDNLRLMELPGFISFEYEQCPAYSPGGEVLLPYADFMCKTHVNDETIHLTQSEKIFVGEPFVSGVYVGTGADSKTVALGFKPSYVQIVRAGSSNGFDIENGSLICCSATLCKNKATIGVLAKSDGFSVVDDENAEIPVRLNDLAMSYIYIAYR